MRVQLMTEYRLACPLGSRITGKLESERIETDWWGLCWRLLRWIHQRLINSRMTAVLQAVIIVTGHALDHADKHEVVGRVDPEPGSGSAIPKQGALAAG